MDVVEPAPGVARMSQECCWRRLAGAIAAAALLLAAPGLAPGQERPTLTPTDYGRWEELGSSALSPDGRWIAYRVTRVSEENELRVRALDEDSTRVVPLGTGPVFSANSRWLAWSVEVSGDERKRLERENQPVRPGAGLLDLKTGQRQSFEDVQSFEFDATGRFLALHRTAPGEPEGKGADLRLLDLATGTSITLGNVAEYLWNGSASLLALAISTGEGEGNGVQLYDADGGRLKSLDASDSVYRRLAWREKAPDLALLRSRDPAAEEGSAYDVLAWRGLDGEAPVSFLLSGVTPGVADTLQVAGSDRPRWSRDGRGIAIGLRPAGPDPGAQGGRDVVGAEAVAEVRRDSTSAEGEEEELAGVKIWHTSDRRIVPQQQVSEASDERRTLLAVWHLREGHVVQIGTDLRGDAELLEGWARAVEEIAEPYAWGEMFGRPYHDIWVVDVGTGGRERVLERVRYDWRSATGRWIVSYDGANYHSLDLESGQRYDLTSGLPTTFADTAYDTPTDVLPPHGFGPGGWLEDDAAVFLYDERDIWRVAPDGSGAVRLTRGREEDVTHRIVRDFDRARAGFAGLGEGDEELGFDPDEPLYLSLHGEWTEKRGYARLRTAGGDVGAGGVERLIYQDRHISGLTKADSADVYLFQAEAFDDPPDLFVAGPDLAGAMQVTEMNPFFAEYAWGRAGLVDFVSETGRDLQAVLLYPAGYEEGHRVPMIVYTYETLSPTIHFFTTPSETRYYNFTVWTQQGYAVLLPDIVYRARDPGMSALESVRPAVARVVEMGVADPRHVGLIGHSWGGYQATFLPTRTDIFAASVAGAPLTDFVSFMGAIHWNPGFPEVFHWETGQARMEVPFWEDPEAHRRNSPIHRVQDLDTPLLMAFGDEDSVVDWYQGTEFYNFARRAGKQMVLLVYEGESHGLRQEANAIDYHRRILEWFGHYLKGDPAPAWITDGIPLDQLEEEKRRVARKRGSSS